jgi:methyltransferase
VKEVMPGLDSRWVFTAVVAAVAFQRLAELRLSNRHEAALRRRGAVEAGASHYPWMVALHAAFLSAAPLEVWRLQRPFLPTLAAAMAILLVAATALRYWTIRTLGERWTTRVICLPGSAAVTGGPFRWLRHPNYLAVLIETFALPLLHTAWLTAAVFLPLNALLLRRRIAVEEEALGENTDYDESFGRHSG